MQINSERREQLKERRRKHQDRANYYARSLATASKLYVQHQTEVERIDRILKESQSPCASSN